MTDTESSRHEFIEALLEAFGDKLLSKVDTTALSYAVDHMIMARIAAASQPQPAATPEPKPAQKWTVGQTVTITAKVVAIENTGAIRLDSGDELSPGGLWYLQDNPAITPLPEQPEQAEQPGEYKPGDKVWAKARVTCANSAGAKLELRPSGLGFEPFIGESGGGYWVHKTDLRPRTED